MTDITKNARVNVVDSLRGFAVCGIIMIHFLEHMNFYSFPKPNALDTAVWDTVFFLGASKMYAIFALLFGFSCFIQHDNQDRKGIDFRPRFAWRMVLLFLWGMLDLVFFNGDILCTYAAMGLLLIPVVKANDRVLKVLAVIFLLQPIELIYFVLSLIDPSTHQMNLGTGRLWGALFGPCAQGSFLDVAKVNLKYGLQINFGWALENGRLTQTYALFLVGLILGRKRLFLNEGNNLQVWKKIMWGSVIAFIILQPVYMYVPGLFANNRTANFSVDVMLKAWRNLAMMCFYVSGIVLLFYKTNVQKALMHLSYIGKMSLSCYLIQSIVGGLLFYNWGFGAYKWSRHTYSLLLSFAFLVLLYLICKWWTSNHRRGPLEEIWARLTNIGRKD